jgi:hypothetical protein
MKYLNTVLPLWLSYGPWRLNIGEQKRHNPRRRALDRARTAASGSTGSQHRQFSACTYGSASS